LAHIGLGPLPGYCAWGRISLQMFVHYRGNMKRMLVIVLALACAACAPVVTKVNVPDIGKFDAVFVTNMRPATEKERKIFSLMITCKEYGIWRVGDTRLSSSPVKLLQYQIAKQ